MAERDDTTVVDRRTEVEDASEPSIALASFSNDHFDPGASFAKRSAWFLANASILQSKLNPSSRVRVALLRQWGASVGRRVVIKPGVNIKYPWLLTIGDDTWIGEDVWIDNLAPVRIGNNVCISQGALLIAGSHDYKRTSFDLRTGAIEIADGTWIGARSTVCLGVSCGSHSVLAAGSVATSNLEARMVYQGNPAAPKRRRVITG